jgi:hypothetical protein
MTRRSYQIKAEQARNERFKTISVRLTPEDYAAFAEAANERQQSIAGMARELIRCAAGLPKDTLES